MPELGLRHKNEHKTGGNDAFAVADLLDALARLNILKGGTSIGTRRGLNLIEGSNIALTVTDDATNERVNTTIAAIAFANKLYKAAASAPTTTTSTSYVDLTNMSIAWTPQTGVTYRKALVTFFCVTKNSSSANLNVFAIADGNNNYISGAYYPRFVASDAYQTHSIILAYLLFPGGTAITTKVRWYVGGGTGTVADRELSIIEVE